MAFDALADAVTVIHLAFIVFVAVGALFASRWRRLVWLHLPAVAWGAGIVAVGYDCPLTPLEKWLRRRAGDQPYEGGFVDRYVEDVIYPAEMTPLLRVMAAMMIVAGYVRFFRREPYANDIRTCAASGDDASVNPAVRPVSVVLTTVPPQKQ